MISSGLPTVGISILTYKRPKSLLRLLGCLADQKHTDFRDIDVSIVNDGSHFCGYADDYDQYPFHVSYLARARAEDDTPQAYSCRNFGVMMTEGDVIWMLDDDLIFDDHTLFILRLYHMLWESQNPILVPHFANPSEPHHFQAPFPFRPDLRQSSIPRTWLDSGGTSMRRQAFEDVGGEDERYDGSMGFHDLDLGIRLHRRGCNVSLVDGVTCFKDDSESNGSFRDKLIRAQMPTDPHRNGRYFIEKWGPELAAEYGIVWTKEDEAKTGIFWNGSRFCTSEG